MLSQNAYTYDDDGQRLTNTVSTQPLDPSTGNPQVDANNNPVLTSRTEAYTYDDLNRLKTADYGDGEAQHYTFDAMGNRLSKSDAAGGGTASTAYTYDAANRLAATTGAGAFTYACDADGNTLSRPGAGALTWDSQNRLVGAAGHDYTYGADGLRRAETVTPSGGPAVATNNVYDGTMLVQERRGGGTLATYLGGARGPECRVDETQPAVETGYTSGKQTFQRGPARWYVYDGLGSVVGEVDPSGNLTSSGTYDVYGAKRQGGTGTASSRQGFVGGLGHVTDAETGLVYMRARYYDPQTGRFVSEDPAKSGGNWFAYANDNPINTVDFSGKAGEDLPDFEEGLNELYEHLLELFDTASGIKAQESIATKFGTWASEQYERILGKDYLSDLVKQMSQDTAEADVNEVAAEVAGNDMIAAREAVQAAGLGKVAAEGDEMDAVEP